MRGLRVYSFSNFLMPPRKFLLEICFHLWEDGKNEGQTVIEHLAIRKRVQRRGNCSSRIWECCSALKIDLCKPQAATAGHSTWVVLQSSGNPLQPSSSKLTLLPENYHHHRFLWPSELIFWAVSPASDLSPTIMMGLATSNSQKTITEHLCSEEKLLPNKCFHFFLCCIWSPEIEFFMITMKKPLLKQVSSNLASTEKGKFSLALEKSEIFLSFWRILSEILLK